LIGSQLSLQYDDLITGKGLLDSEGWKEVLGIQKAAYEIQGIPSITNAQAIKYFIQDQTLAMAANSMGFSNDLFDLAEKGVKTMNWDIVTFPSFKQRPGVSSEIDASVLSINSQSKYRKEAFEVINYVTSDELQSRMAPLGSRLPAINNKEYYKQYGSQLKGMQGKNINALLISDPAEFAQPTEYRDLGIKELNAANNEVLKKGTDINTALREANDRLTKAIAAEKEKK
jgi:multiple sugar transport system substrate-binding protein